MGMMESPWDDLSFALKVDINHSAISCTNFQTASLHKIRATVHVPTYLAIYASLYQDPDSDLLGPFPASDVNAEPLCICKEIYPTTPFVGVFLEQELTQ